MKLYGGYSAAMHVKRSRKQPVWKKILLVVLILLLLGEGCYFTFVYSTNSFISHWRNVYIETALSTMRHQWLATKLLPGDIVTEVSLRIEQAKQEQIGMESTWGDAADTPTVSEPDKPAPTPDNPSTPTVPGETEPEDTLSPEALAFFETFWEIDQDSMLAYVEQHPEVLRNGWDGIDINEAGLQDGGTTIETTMGEQVLAIHAKSKTLLVRVKGSKNGASYRGVLAIAKDPAQLDISMSRGIGSYGQYAGDIASENGGILAMTANGFIDNEGRGNGGILAGYTVSHGKGYGQHYGWGAKRLELREDDRLYIVDAQSSIHPDTTDAAEFMPAMIIDGEIVVTDRSGWDAVNPRASIGQSKKGEILMLVIEGRLPTLSLGTDVVECAEILKRHDCYQALNMDGGTSAIMWFNGKYVTQCSNTNCPSGRTLPNAWVYHYEE